MNPDGKLKREARRDDILHRAMAAFGRSNFHRTTVKSIAREAGVSEGLLYQHFATKESLFVETLRKASDELNGALERIVSDHALDPLAALGKAYVYFSQYLKGAPEYGRLVFAALSESNDPAFKAVIGDNIARAEEILVCGLRRAMEAGILRSDLNLDLARWIFVSGYHYMMVMNRLGRLPEPDAALLSAVLEPILSGAGARIEAASKPTGGERED